MRDRHRHHWRVVAFVPLYDSGKYYLRHECQHCGERKERLEPLPPDSWKAEPIASVMRRRDRQKRQERLEHQFLDTTTATVTEARLAVNLG